MAQVIHLKVMWWLFWIPLVFLLFGWRAALWTVVVFAGATFVISARQMARAAGTWF